MFNFKYLRKVAEEQLKKGQLFFKLGTLDCQVYSHNIDNAFTIYLSMNNEPLVKMVFVPKGQVKLYFPKRNYPREIGYNAVVFPETENICVLKSVHVLTQYPMAEAIYNELLLGCRGKVR